MWIWLVVLLVLGALAFVRLAPTDVDKVHRAVQGTQDKTGKGFCLRVLPGEADLFGRIDAAMRGLERTQVVVGSVDEGRVSYVTRSKAVGFPDYTTVEAADGQIKIYARLRFGRSDFGVNRARVDHVAALMNQRVIGVQQKHVRQLALQ